MIGDPNVPARWVKVEFFGLLPVAQQLTDVDILEVSANLMTTFGFTHIDRLTAVDITTCAGDDA